MTTELFHRRDDCRLCHSTDVEVAVALQPIPIKTPNIGCDGREGVETVRAPLDLYRCTACGHLQLLHVVDPELQYTEFRYRTAISLGLSDHFASMASDITSRLGLGARANVLEVGSNDGTLLRALHAHGLDILGIDPAREIACEATDAGIPTLAAFFNARTARRIQDTHGRFDLVVANNTFANIDDLDDLVAALDAVLTDDGVLVVETQDGAALLEHTLIDTVYHEHLSYFLVKPVRDWLARKGFALFDVERQPTKGGSLRLWIQRVGGKRATSESVDRIVAEEIELGLYESAVYERFAAGLKRARVELSRLIREHRRQGAIAAYGASVGTVTLLEQFGIAHALDFIVDDAPLAESITGPDYSIPVIGPDEFMRKKPSLVIILAHRYADAIIEKRSEYLDRGGVVAVPLPELRVLEHAA